MRGGDCLKHRFNSAVDKARRSVAAETQSTWPRGPMDKASAYGAGDCRFESCRGHCSKQGCGALQVCVRPCMPMHACRYADHQEIIFATPTPHSLKGTWCSGITSAPHAEGPGFKSQCVHAYQLISPHVPMPSAWPPQSIDATGQRPVKPSFEAE